MFNIWKKLLTFELHGFNIGYGDTLQFIVTGCHLAQSNALEGGKPVFFIWFSLGMQVSQNYCEIKQMRKAKKEGEIERQ